MSIHIQVIICDHVLPLGPVRWRSVGSRKRWMVGIWYLINVLYLVMPGIGILVAFHTLLAAPASLGIDWENLLGKFQGWHPTLKLGRDLSGLVTEGNPQKFCKSKDPPALHCLLSSWQDSLPPCQWWIYCSYLACVMVELMGKGVGL